MYTINSFYNVDIFKDKTLDIILDDLTKAVSRPYIISYVKDLIEKKTPFTMLMLDVDNICGSVFYKPEKDNKKNGNAL